MRQEVITERTSWDCTSQNEPGEARAHLRMSLVRPELISEWAWWGQSSSQNEPRETRGHLRM